MKKQALALALVVLSLALGTLWIGVLTYIVWNHALVEATTFAKPLDFATALELALLPAMLFLALHTRKSDER